MIKLDCQALSVVVAPEVGVAIVGWTDASTQVLRRTAPDALMHDDVRGFACYPLVPFCNRIGHARFTWQGEARQLGRNFAAELHAIHGVGWQHAWTPETVSADAVTLRLQHDPAGAGAEHWPFPFAATVSYRLLPRALTVQMTVANRHSSPVPAGIGLHPFFPRVAGTTLRFAATGVWITEDKLPARHVPIPREWDHAGGIPVGRLPLDNCFTEWGRTARIGTVVVQADEAFPNLQVFTPSGWDSFAVEPVSHVPDAINRPDLSPGQAMQVLQPGESLTGTVTFTLAGRSEGSRALAG